MALIILFFEGYNLDAFALPQLWMMPGLLTASLISRPMVEKLETEP